MPYKNPDDRLRAGRRWRQESTPEYHRWLYARRVLRFEKAEMYERLLRQIGNREVDDPVAAARVWLDEFDDREKRVGRWFDHALNMPSNERTQRRTFG